MALLTLRDEKGIPLTHQEMDANLRNLNAEGVTGGNAHDHTTGNGAPIPYNSLTGKPTLGTAAAANVESFEPSGVVGTHEAASDPHPGYALESSLGTAATANVESFEPSGVVGTHEAASDPHPGYALESSLGTAATANVTTSTTDTTAGRVLKVGAGASQLDATLYRKGNILGTVSQASGVPTGAIIERGSNANGEYVKFADGTLICVHALAIGGVWSDGVELTRSWIFPASFSVTPFTEFQYISGGGAGNGIGKAINSIANDSMSMIVKNNTGYNIGTSEYRIAIGRWF